MKNSDFLRHNILTPFNFHRMNYMEQHERVSKQFAIDWRKYLCKTSKSTSRYASFNKLETQHTIKVNIVICYGAGKNL